MSSDWKEALAPTPDCLAIERLGGDVSDAERAHLDTCVRCQTELALFREVMSEESSSESEWIAAELRRREKKKVVAFRPRNAVLALAAMLALVIGIGAWMQMREPDVEVDLRPGIYRSARLDVIAPIGDLAKAPNELRWEAVPNATVYDVEILEVDASQVWSSRTTETHIVLPPEVIAQFQPGKTLTWDVRALRNDEEVAASQTQEIRVRP